MLLPMLDKDHLPERVRTILPVLAFIALSIACLLGVMVAVILIRLAFSL